MKTWPPRHNSCCQRCALVKRLSEEKGSLFNSSSLTPCHCGAGTEPRAGRVVRAALYLVSSIPVLKIRRLRSPTSPLQGLIITKTTIDLCMGLTVNPALSRLLIIRFFPKIVGVGGDIGAIFKNEGTGDQKCNDWLKDNKGHSWCSQLQIPQTSNLLSPLYLVHPRSDTRMRSPVLCRMTAVPVRMQMKRESEVASFLPLSLFFRRSAQATPFHLVFTGKRGPVKTLSVRKRKKRIKSPLSSVTASVMVETHSLQAYKNPCKMRVSFQERNFRFWNIPQNPQRTHAGY